MTITSGDGIVAGLISPWIFFKALSLNKAAGDPHAQGLIAAGIPAVFASASPGLAGATVDGTTSTLGGTIPFINPGSGASYLAKLSVMSNTGVAGIGFFDLLWYNSGIVSATTTAQTVSSVTLPARDATGTTNGAGVTAYLYCAIATTNGSAITGTTITYTNSAGTGSKTGTIGLAGFPATATAGTFIPFTLAAGDVGIKSVQSITLATSYGTGTVLLMLVREISFISFAGAAGSGQMLDWAQCGFPQLYNGTALSFYAVPTGTSCGVCFGDVAYAQG